jgi:cyclic 2,3-diphosphoglycerate synthetase
MAEEGSAWREARTAIAGLTEAPVVPVVLRPRPVEPVAGRRIAFFSTAPEQALPRLSVHLAEAHGAEVVHASGSLARRDALIEELEGLDADAFVVEIKAAAIDVVAEAAAARGIPVVFADNEVLPLPGEGDLDAELEALARAAAADRVLQS